jgi:hypothetical protein
MNKEERVKPGSLLAGAVNEEDELREHDDLFLLHVGQHDFYPSSAHEQELRFLVGEVKTRIRLVTNVDIEIESM